MKNISESKKFEPIPENVFPDESVDFLWLNTTGLLWYSVHSDYPEDLFIVFVGDDHYSEKNSIDI